MALVLIEINIYTKQRLSQAFRFVFFMKTKICLFKTGANLIQVYQHF